MSYDLPPVYIPPDFYFNHVVGAECHFLGPLCLVIQLTPGKTALSHAEYRKICDYITTEGFLCDEHKTWLKTHKRMIVPVVTDSNQKRLQFNEEIGAYVSSFL